MDNYKQSTSYKVRFFKSDYEPKLYMSQYYILEIVVFQNFEKFHFK